MLTKICDLCIPPLFFAGFLKYCCRLFFRDSICVNKINFFKMCDNVVVLGNGPSLRSDRDRIVSRIGISDFVCVNTFCKDELYVILKPRMYVFLDPIFFTERVNQYSQDKREHVFEILNTKTEWDMLVLLPGDADISVLRNVITNRYIHILKYNVQESPRILRYGATLKIAFDLGFYGPPRANVLLYALFLSIKARYNKIELFGADFDYHKKLEVDQDTNELLLRSEYFNAPAETVPIQMTTLQDDRLMASMFFDDVSAAYGAFNILELYAKDCKIKIVNCSSYSMLDMFERRRSDL